MIPDEFPQDAAHAHLLLRSQFLAGDNRIVGFLHLVLLEGHLHDLIAQVDEGDARGVVAAVQHHIDSFSELLVIIEEMDGVCVVIHSGIILNDGANIGIFLKRASRRTKKPNFFHTYINMSLRFCTFAPEKLSKMVTELLVVWIVGVVAFFALWAILLKVIKRISEKKSQTKEAVQEKPDDKENSPK